MAVVHQNQGAESGASNIHVFEGLVHRLCKCLVIVQKISHRNPVLLQVPINTQSLIEYRYIILRECIVQIGKGMTVLMTELYSHSIGNKTIKNECIHTLELCEVLCLHCFPGRSHLSERQ